MKKIYYLLTLLIAIAFLSLTSCNDFVNNVTKPNNAVPDEELNNPDGVDFLATGVEAKFAQTHWEMVVLSGLLGDEFCFTFDIGASFEPWQPIDNALISGTNALVPDNFWTSVFMNDVPQLLHYADTLAVRIKNKVIFSNSSADQAKRTRGLYNSFFYGAVARYYWASYWGLDAKNPNDDGGGVINASAYIPAKKMYEDALVLLDSALTYANSTQIQTINTFKARIFLYLDRYSEASTAADLGLPLGSSFLVLYNANSSIYNELTQFTNNGQLNAYTDSRFHDYLIQNPDESNRIKLDSVTGQSGAIYYLQAKCTSFGDPITFASGEENNLIKAECAIRISGDSAGALVFINQMRMKLFIHSLVDFEIQKMGGYLNMLYIERDKQLCFTGLRLRDERRFHMWHLDTTNTWQFLPISQTERDLNKNLH
jgi:hypothetical protein